MSVSRVEVLVEEPSMEVALERLIPAMLGPIEHKIRVFSGKKASRHPQNKRPEAALYKPLFLEG